MTALKKKMKFFYFDIPNFGKQPKAAVEPVLMDTIAELTTSERPIDVTVSVESPAVTTVDKTRLQKFASMIP
jgi:hypothetical protein